jgi:hypothetical protein
VSGAESNGSGHGRNVGQQARLRLNDGDREVATLLTGGKRLQEMETSI